MNFFYKIYDALTFSNTSFIETNSMTVDSQKLDLGLPDGGNCMTLRLRSLVLIYCQHVTDRQPVGCS